MRPYFKKFYHKKLDWWRGLKVKALSSSPKVVNK
jgi:hypothetical protein